MKKKHSKKSSDDEHNDDEKKKELTVRIENEIEKKRLRQITDIELLKRIKRITKKSKNETMKLR